jgi:hypothetical protein
MMSGNENAGAGRQQTIRFAILCTQATLEHWQVRCLEYLQALDGVKLALIILIARGGNQPRTIRQTLNAALSNFTKLLFLFYTRFICRSRARRPVDMTGVFSEIPIVAAKLLDEISQPLTNGQIEMIRRHDLDFILKLGSENVHGEILSAARYGVWSFSEPEEEKYDRGPQFFWEIYHGDDVTEAVLQRLTNRSGGSMVLQKGVFRTEKRSYAMNADQIYYESAKWPALMCAAIRNGNVDCLNEAPCQRVARVGAVPNNFQMLCFAIKIICNRLAFAWKRLFRHPQWNIGLAHDSVDAFLIGDKQPDIHWFPLASKAGFLADPFGIARNAKLTVLCEYFDYRSGKGHICSIDLLDKNFSTGPKPAIDLPVHMSYPYLVEHQGDIYCIPETSQAREVSLFKAEKFPTQWVKVGTLIKDFAGVDTTVFQYGAGWWLMCTDSDNDADTNLMVWHAPDLLGPWLPHAANPVKTDVRSARPAGTPFIHRGQLYRPAQDCSKTYGGRIVLNRVMRLTTREFKEEPVSVIEPAKSSPFPCGRHTLSAMGKLTLIDGHRFVFVGNALKCFLIIWFRQVLGTGLAGRDRRGLARGMAATTD